MPRKKTGKTGVRNIEYASIFYTDIFPDDMEYAVLVRSSIARGKLLSVTVPALPAGYAFFSAEDIPGENSLKTYKSEMPVFASGEIHYKGEPLGILTGPDETELYRLLPLITAETEELPPLEFSGSFADSQIMTKRIVSVGDTHSIIQKSKRVVENTYRTIPNYQNFSETDGAIVRSSKESTEIYSPTRWPSHLRAAVSAVTGCPEQSILIHQTLPGERTASGLWFPSMAAAQAAVASFHTGKTVKLVLSRYEDFHYTEQEAPVEIRHTTAVDDDGIITAMDIRIIAEGGAYSPFMDEIIDRIVIASRGIYNPAAYHIEAFAVTTSKPPFGTGADWGESQAFYALETHIQEAARLFNLNPADIKLKNCTENSHAGDGCWTIKDKSLIPAVLSKVMKESDFMRKYTSYSFLAAKRESISDGPLRGIGITTAYQGSGFLEGSQTRGTYTMEVTMEKEGSVTVKADSFSPAMKQIWTKLAASILEITPDLIRFDTESSGNDSSKGPETLSSNITIVTQLLKKCCMTIQKQRFRQPLPIAVKRTYNPAKKKAWNSETFSGIPYNAVAWGAAAVEIEIDPLTYETDIRGIWLAADGGEILAEKAARNTLNKSVLQSFAKTASDCTYPAREKKQPVTSSFDGFLFRSMPAPKIFLIRSENESKGIGELAFNLIPGAYCAAVNQAVRAAITEIPITTGSVYSLLKGSDGRA